MSPRLGLFGVSAMPSIEAGDDLASIICERIRLEAGDVLAVTSKVVSKAEGRVAGGTRADAVEAEVDRVVARRGGTVIARTRTGLVLAAAGVDESNVEVGSLVLLPLDPDGSARALRERIAARAGINVAVVITDTAGRPWRVGQTDIAIGCAGLAPLADYAGRVDPFGNLLQVTAPAVADEIAAATDLVKGKLSATPVAVLRGAPALVLPPDQHGPGAAALVRPAADDLFGLGAREAVSAAAARCDPAALEAFPPQPVEVAELLAAASERLDPAAGELSIVAVQGSGQHVIHGRLRGSGGADVHAAVALGAAAERLCALAVSSGWVVTEEPTAIALPPRPPGRATWRPALQAVLSPRPS